MSANTHTQTTKPEASAPAGTRSAGLLAERPFRRERDVAKDNGLRVREQPRRGALYNPNSGHNLCRISIHPLRSAIQPKLKVSEPDDIYEREADRVAEQVMRMPDPVVQRKPGGPFAQGPSCGDDENIQAKPVPEQITPLLQREAAGSEIDEEEDKIQAKLVDNSFIQREEGTKEDEEENAIQAKSNSDHAREAPPAAESAIESLRGGGQPLPESARSFFEPRFGHDFSRVKIHHDARAAGSARAVNAHAFTVGNNIVFDTGRYSPGTEAGKRLLAHELTHVVQQSGMTRVAADHAGTHDQHQIQDGTCIDSSVTSAASTHERVNIIPFEIEEDSRIQRQGGGGAARVVIGRAIRWLAGRGKTISRHVARHTHRIAGRAIHSVFRRPNQVKKLVQRALEAPENVLVQQGARRTRYIVEKQFNRAIGKQGETILHVVMDVTGRIVTAYPISSFTRAGVAAGVLVLALDEAAAEARERLNTVEAEAQRRLEAAQPSFWEELFLDLITFGLYGGGLNVGEDVELWADREVAAIHRDACSQVITAVEVDERRNLGEDERREICELVTVALGVPEVMAELGEAGEEE